MEREGGSGLKRMGVGCLGVKGRGTHNLSRAQKFLTTALAQRGNVIVGLYIGPGKVHMCVCVCVCMYVRACVHKICQLHNISLLYINHAFTIFVT